MFGLIRPCPHGLGPERLPEYRAHLCGVCRTLRLRAGGLSRAALNRDALVLSMLVEHLAPAEAKADLVPANRCVLRGMRRATIIDPGSPAARYAAAVSLLLLHIGAEDHATDRDSGRLPARLALPVTTAWQRRATALLPAAAPAFAAVRACVRRENEVHERPGLPFEAYVRDTEEAFGHCFAAVAAVAGCPERADDLRTLGEAYGRVAAVVDALEDHEADSRRGGFNLLRAGWPQSTTRELGGHATEVLARAHATVEASLDRLDVGTAGALPYLLRTALRRRTANALREFYRQHGYPPATKPVTAEPFTAEPSACRRHPGAPRPPRGRARRRPVTGVASALGLIPIVALCCDGCDCDCGDCDCCDCDGCCDGCGGCGGCCEGCGDCCDCCDCGGGRPRRQGNPGCFACLCCNGCGSRRANRRRGRYPPPPGPGGPMQPGQPW